MADGRSVGGVGHVDAAHSEPTSSEAGRTLSVRPLGSRRNGCGALWRQAVSGDATALSDDPGYVVAATLKRLYPSNPDIVLGREARNIVAALSDAGFEIVKRPIGPQSPPVTRPARTVEVSDRTGRTDPDLP